MTAPPGSRYSRTDAAPWHYTKASGVGNTGWKASNDGATVTAPTGTGFAHVTALVPSLSLAAVLGVAYDELTAL